MGTHSETASNRAQVDSPPVRADMTIELREKQPRSQPVERLAGEQQHPALLPHGVDDRA